MYMMAISRPKWLIYDAITNISKDVNFQSGEASKFLVDTGEKACYPTSKNIQP